MTEPFQEFGKIGRLSRDMVITEKIDGTNAQVYIADDGQMLFGSRTRYITPEQDNHGFARWATDHREELLTLGPGHHFGEWWGGGIQRGYGLPKGEKRFSLFNVHRWSDEAGVRPACCHIVPVLLRWTFDTAVIQDTLTSLGVLGSAAAPGFMQPEGIVVFHSANGALFKKTLEKDEMPKGIRP